MNEQALGKNFAVTFAVIFGVNGIGAAGSDGTKR